MILETQNVAIAFGRKTILRDVSLRIPGGGLFGLVGENGSGKSTLLKIIIGQLKPDAGRIIVKGTSGYCPQYPLVFPQLTVDENFQYFSAAYGLKSTGKDQRAELLRHFNFDEYRDHRVSDLSGGTRQKLNLSIALLHDPDILILDEPYSGFDWDTYVRFWEYTDTMLERGRLILVVAHLLTETERFDKIYQLKHGQLE